MSVANLMQSGPQLLDGAAGALEVIIDAPKGEARGIAIVCHPQPLLGGHAMRGDLGFRVDRSGSAPG